MKRVFPNRLSGKQRAQTTGFPPQPRRVHVITDRFSLANTYLIVDEAEKVVVVDPGSEVNVRMLCFYLEKFLNLSSAAIDLVVLTHLHPDHTAGVEALHHISDAPITASIAARHLADIEQQEGKMLPKIGQLAGRVLPETLQLLDIFPSSYVLQARLVTTWLEDVGGLPEHLDWRVIACPGHTPESLCLYNPFTYELLCGDTVVAVEGGNPLLRAGARRRRAQETLRLLRSLEVRYLYPGHGRPILSCAPLSTVEIE